MEFFKHHETHQEHETREQGDFSSVESNLPSLESRGSITEHHPFDKLSSYLGEANPLAHEADFATSTLWLLNNTAWRSPPGLVPSPATASPEGLIHTAGAAIAARREGEAQWVAEFCVAYFRRDSGASLSKTVAEVADLIGVMGAGPEVEQRMRTRLQPFVDAILPARWAYVRIGPEGKQVMKLGPGGRSGISEDVRAIDGQGWKNRDTMISGLEIDGKQIVNGQGVPEGAEGSRRGTTYFAEAEGWMVISDIDDTIKTTMTPSALGILKSTFADPTHAIDGMPELYARINALLSPTWFYLSASPYNLYPFLYEFVYGSYPHGQIVLRDASWMNLSGFLASLTKGTQAYKVGRMDKIHSWLPLRKVVCVGDSTQTDPESYGEIYRKYPGWVKRIFIRKVTDVSEMKGTDKNEPARFEKAFQGVPKDVWRTFVQPEELSELVEAIPSITG